MLLVVLVVNIIPTIKSAMTLIYLHVWQQSYQRKLWCTWNNWKISQYIIMWIKIFTWKYMVSLLLLHKLEIFWTQVKPWRTLMVIIYYIYPIIWKLCPIWDIQFYYTIILTLSHNICAVKLKPQLIILKQMIYHVILHKDKATQHYFVFWEILLWSINRFEFVFTIVTTLWKVI